MKQNVTIASGDFAPARQWEMSFPLRSLTRKGALAACRSCTNFPDAKLVRAARKAMQELDIWITLAAPQQIEQARLPSVCTMFADDSEADDIEGILKELSEYMEHEI